MLISNHLSNEQARNPKTTYNVIDLSLPGSLFKGGSPTMQSPFSLLSPFVICAASAGFIVLIAASIFLIRDLIKMRREYQAGAPSVWYRRPMTFLCLVGIGFSLLVLLAALEWSFPAPLPFTIFTVSLIGLSVVIDSSRLISDIRNEQQERGEGFPSVWHRRPKTLREIG
jgi:hypothetical protein